METWATLGTWAAVMVAVAIALKDTFERRRDRAGRHLLVTAEIFPEVTRLQAALAAAVEEADEALATGDAQAQADAAEAIEAVIQGLTLDGLRGYADQPDALPERMLIPLAKAMTMMRMLRENAAARRARLSKRRGAEDALLLNGFEEWHTQGKEVLRSLDHVTVNAQQMLESRRWKEPT